MLSTLHLHDDVPFRYNPYSATPFHSIKTTTKPTNADIAFFFQNPHELIKPLHHRPDKYSGAAAYKQPVGIPLHLPDSHHEWRVYYIYYYPVPGTQITWYRYTDSDKGLSVYIIFYILPGTGIYHRCTQMPHTCGYLSIETPYRSPYA